MDAHEASMPSRKLHAISAAILIRVTQFAVDFSGAFRCGFCEEAAVDVCPGLLSPSGSSDGVMGTALLAGFLVPVGMMTVRSGLLDVITELLLGGLLFTLPWLRSVEA